MTFTVKESQELDFERLTETSMEWRATTWMSQVGEGRFEGSYTFHHSHIYWFENYASLILARDILIDFKEDFTIMWDNAMNQWTMTSSYVTEGWR
jgi:hypothetical protein